MPRRADRTDPHGASTAHGQRQQQAASHSLLVKQVNSSKPDPEEMGRMHRLLVEQNFPIWERVKSQVVVYRL